ncbi:MAG: DNA polymerase III subunit delta, partial [Candidatus Aerophobetes bacterium]|nr:DNA polymerase III subunit delta [Candidatus Aerophobetes bacterium]
KIYRLFLKKGKIVSFPPLWDNEALTWIRKKVEEKGKKIALEASVYLREKIGNNLSSLNNEIEKLSVFVHPDQLIGKEDVKEVTGEGKEAGVFDLTKAIREKNLVKALFILSQLWERREDPLRVHSLIVREIRILLRLKEKPANISAYQSCPVIFGRKKYYPKFYQDIATEYIQAVKKFSLFELIGDYEQLLETEASIKTGKEDPDVAMENLVLNLLIPPSLQGLLPLHG